MATLDLNREAVLDMIGAGRGPQDGVWIPLVFVEWLGSYTTAAMMNQILYYRDIKRRKGEDEFYMSYPQWQEALHLTEREVRNGLDKVRQVGVITKAKRAPNGDRVLYYRVDAAVFLAALQAFLSDRSVQNVRTEADDTDGPGTDETYGRSNTKTSPKNSAKRETPAPVDIAPIVIVPEAPRDMPTIGRAIKPTPIRQAPLPPGYPLTEEMRVWAAMELPALADRIDTEHKKFCNHYWSKAERRADWRPAWESWMIRAVDDFAPKPPQKGSTSNGYESKTERNERILRNRIARWQADAAAGDADHQEPRRLPA
jgi:hypothetical protein